MDLFSGSNLLILNVEEVFSIKQISYSFKYKAKVLIRRNMANVTFN